MRIGAEDHGADAGQHLTGILVDDCLMRRYIDAAVPLCAGETKHVVILIDRSADCAKGIVAVREYIGDREFLQSRSSRCLNNADIGDVVRRHFVKFDLQMLHAAGNIVRFQDTVGHRLLFCTGLIRLYARLPELCSRIRVIRDHVCSVDEVNASIL